jgi:hypothetical protein
MECREEQRDGWEGGDMYHPFVNLANWCLDKMGVKGVRFCRNNSTIVLDSDATRKSDVVKVRDAVFDKDGRYDALRLPRNEKRKWNKDKNPCSDPSGHGPI